MKRILILLLITPIVLVVGLMLFIQSNQAVIIKDELVKLNQGHKGLIEIGSSELKLFRDFPYISLKAYDVRIFEHKEDNAPIIMDVEDIYLGFNLWDIIQGNYDIQSLFIEKGRFNIVIHENNSTNIQNSLANTSGAESSSTNIHLKKIKISELDVHTLDEATNTDVEKYIYSGVGGFKMKDGIVAGHIDTGFELNVIKEGDTTFIHNKHFKVHTDVEYNEYTGILDIAPSGVSMENGDFELEGTIDTKNDVDLDLSIKGTKPNFDMLIAFAPTDVIPILEKYRNAGEIYFNATVKGPSNKGNRPFINANFGAGKAFLENTKRKKKIDEMGFNGHFTNGKNRNASTMEFSLTDMKASLEKGEFEGAIFIKNFDSPEVEMKVNSNFNLNFIAEFFELQQIQNTSGEVSLKMNFHDIVDIDHPEKALQKINQAYFAQLNIKDLSLEAKELPAPLHNLNANLVMNGKKASLNQFELQIGNSDISAKGYLLDLPAIVHHTDIPVATHLDISSKNLDISELTGFVKQDTLKTGIDEQIKDLSLGLSFKASAKDFTESEHLPKGEFFIDSLYADLKHYPHKLHDFHADVLINDSDLKIVDFKGNIDSSDFHFDGLIRDYAFWMKPQQEGAVGIDVNLTSQTLKLEDLFSYKGENYVPKEYRHEEFNDLSLHFTSNMLYENTALQAVHLDLDKLNTKMKLHPLPFSNFSGNIHYEDQHILIKDLHGEIGSTDFDIALNYYIGKDTETKKKDNYFELKSNHINFDTLLNFDLNTSKETNVVASDTTDVKKHADAFNIYELPFTDMQFKADVASLLYHRIDLKNIKGNLRSTANHYIYIDTLSMDAAGGTIGLNGYFNGSDPKHIYIQPDLQMTNVDLDQLLFKFENFGQDHLVSENLQGKLTSRIKGNIRVYPDMVPDLDQSTIDMDVKILDGRLKNYDPMLALSEFMDDKNLRNIRFDTLQNNLSIQKGKIKIPAMTIASTLGHIELSGTHDSKQNIDYYIRIPWKTVKSAAWQKLFGKKKSEANTEDKEQEDEIVEIDPNKKIKYFNVKVKGNVDDYKISLGKKKN